MQQTTKQPSRIIKIQFLWEEEQEELRWMIKKKVWKRSLFNNEPWLHTSIHFNFCSNLSFFSWDKTRDFLHFPVALMYCHEISSRAVGIFQYAGCSQTHRGSLRLARSTCLKAIKRQTASMSSPHSASHKVKKVSRKVEFKLQQTEMGVKLSKSKILVRK